MLTKLSEAVSIIDTQALSVPNVVAAYLVTGKETAIIDMGYQSSAELVIHDLVGNGVSPDYLLPTHVHLDHSGCCGALAREFTNASVRVHPKGEPHLADPSRLWEGAGELFGDELMARYGRPEPIHQNRLHASADGDVIDLGKGITLRTVWTPGHASHHLSYEWEGHKAFFTGDAVGICSPNFPVLIPTTPPTSFNLEQTLESLERIRANSPVEFYTPHYGVVNKAMRWITENIKSLQHWCTSIERMRKTGLSYEAMTKALTDELAGTIGRPATGMPDYLRTSIEVSVLGVLRYMNRRKC